MEDKDRVSKFSSNALEMAYGDFTIDKMLAKYEKVIEEVVK